MKKIWIPAFTLIVLSGIAAVLLMMLTLVGCEGNPTLDDKHTPEIEQPVIAVDYRHGACLDVDVGKLTVRKPTRLW